MWHGITEKHMLVYTYNINTRIQTQRVYLWHGITEKQQDLCTHIISIPEHMSTKCTYLWHGITEKCQGLCIGAKLKDILQGTTSHVILHSAGTHNGWIVMNVNHSAMLWKQHMMSTVVMNVNHSTMLWNQQWHQRLSWMWITPQWQKLYLHIIFACTKVTFKNTKHLKQSQIQSWSTVSGWLLEMSQRFLMGSYLPHYTSYISVTVHEVRQLVSINKLLRCSVPFY